MTQKIKTEVVFEIPETHVLMEKAVVEDLKERADEVWASGLDWLVDQTSIGNKQTLREMLGANREELEPDYVIFPSSEKGVWRFNAVPMKQWLRDNFSKVVK